MTNSSYSPGQHRLAVLTACVALLPILAGAVVTTKDAGMAFRDWPGSDEYVATNGSLLQDVVRTSHVLCGMLLFVTTVVLAVRITRLLWLSEKTRRTSSHALSSRAA